VRGLRRTLRIGDCGEASLVDRVEQLRESTTIFILDVWGGNPQESPKLFDDPDFVLACMVVRVVET